MVDGVFHDAHEVYLVLTDPDEKVWLGTFPRKEHAEYYVKFLVTTGTTGVFEVVSV